MLGSDIVPLQWTDDKTVEKCPLIGFGVEIIGLQRLIIARACIGEALKSSVFNRVIPEIKINQSKTKKWMFLINHRYYIARAVTHISARATCRPELFHPRKSRKHRPNDINNNQNTLWALYLVSKSMVHELYLYTDHRD